jgi:phosphoribosylformylglycinamidine synthase
MKTGAVVAIQDMGAAGLTSSCFEMAGRGGAGIELDLERVPLREKALTPYEMMLSESQERMVLVVERGKEEVVERVFQRWGLPIVAIGRVSDSGRAVLRFAGEVVADMPVAPLVDAVPVYERPAAPPVDLAQRQAAPEMPVPENPGGALLRLLATPELADKSWIVDQYDSTVRGNTVVGPGGDAAVLRLKGTSAGIALTADVNPVYCWLDPRSGGRQAVAEAARNLACVGALPIALTDCLNFGNPERPEVAWQLRECIRGIAEACRALDVPVVSGNVSLYNETRDRSILPTPTVAMVGLIDPLGETAGQLRTATFLNAGDRLVLLGRDRTELGGSAFLRLLYGIEQGRPPEVDLAAESRLGVLLRRAFEARLPRAVHDVSDGGIAVALAEMTFGRGLGARVTLDADPLGLFSESQGRAVVATAPEDVEALLRLADDLGVPAIEVGSVSGERLRIGWDGGTLDVPVSDLLAAWRGGLPAALGF